MINNTEIKKGKRRIFPVLLLAACLGAEAEASSVKYEHTHSASPYFHKLGQQLRLDESQLAEFYSILKAQNDKRMAISTTNLVRIRAELESLDAELLGQLSSVLNADQLLDFENRLLNNRRHGMAPEGSPLPDAARTGLENENSASVEQ